MYIPSRNIYFLHIQKTAGTSITRWMEQVFLPEIRAAEPRSPSLSYFHQTQARGQLGKSVYFGHYGAYPLVHAPADLYCFTVLRDPVARTLSQIRHTARKQSGRMHPVLMRHKTLLDFLHDPAAEAVLANVQTKSLLSDLMTPALRDYGPELATIGSYFSVAALNWSEPSVKGHLLARLNGPISRVIFAEALERGMQKVCAELGLAGTPPIGRDNVSANEMAGLDDPAVLNRVREMNRLDQMLYDLARERFADTAPIATTHIAT